MSGPPVHRTRFETNASAVPLWLDALEDEGLSVGAFEIAEIEGEDPDLWAIELLHDTAPTPKRFRRGSTPWRPP